MLDLAPWAALQLVAVITAGACFLFRVRRHRFADRLFLAFPIGMTGVVAGAIGLGTLLRGVGSLAGGQLPRLALAQPMAWGALLGFAGAFALAAHALRVPVADALDRAAPSLALLVIFGRIGCAIAGCDFGALTDLPWAVHYPEGTAAFGHHVDHGWIATTAHRSLGVHPTQAYESIVGVAAWVAAVAVERRGRPVSGDAFAAAALVYAAGRFAIEWLRADDGRGSFGPLSLPQWIALAVVVAVVTRRRGQPPARQSTSTVPVSVHGDQQSIGGGVSKIS